MRKACLGLLALLVLACCAFQEPLFIYNKPPAGGGGVTWTLIQGTAAAARNFTCTSAACSTGTVTATTAGDLEILLWASFSDCPSCSPLTSTASSGDTLTHCTGFPKSYNYNGGSSWELIDCWYKLSATGGATSFTLTPTWNGAANNQTQDVQYLQYRRSTGTATFDALNSSQNNTCTSNLCAAPSNSITGTADVCVQFLAVASNPPTAISGAYGNPVNLDSTNVFGGFAGALNVASYSAPNWSVTHSGNDGAQAGVACWS